jgi:predicted HicB family RNase H-like nuclease
MDAKQVLKELIQSVDELDLYIFLLRCSNMGIKSEDETSDKIEINYRQIRHEQINTWIDKAIEAVYEKPEKNNLPSIEEMIGLLE